METANDDTYRCCDEYADYRRRAPGLTSRANFLKTTAGVLAAAPFAPHLLLDSAVLKRTTPAAPGNKILVLVQLQGGNDGLNTIVPYGSDLYYAGRPNIAVPAKSVLPIDAHVGFNANLAGLKTLYDAGKVAVVQGAGYANPNRSHFASTAIWETGDPSGLSTTGWIGRYLDGIAGDSTNPLTAVALGPRIPQTLASIRAPITAIENVRTFRFGVTRGEAASILGAYNAMYGSSNGKVPTNLALVKTAGLGASRGVADLQSVKTTYTSSVQYPANALAGQLQIVAQLIGANLGTRVFHVSLGGFDDHVAEVFRHAALLKDLGESLKAFYDDLAAQNRAGDVLTMTFSEFGRRVRENAGRGTDHGTAAPMFVVGDSVKGGLYGADPILGTLDDNGDLVYGLDFRSVYGTVLDGWLGASAKAVLGSSFERVGFL